MHNKNFSKHIFLIFIFLTIQTFFTTTINAAELPAHLKAQAKKLHDRCQKQTGVPEELIRKAHSGKIPDDGTIKCYIHCLFNIVGLIDENQVIHLENLIEILPADVHPIIQNLVDKCGTKKGVDPCDTAYQTMQCYFEADLNSLQALITFVFD